MEPITLPGLSFDLKAAPRITVGYTAANGMGIRARWWEFSQVETGNAQDPADFIDVDTYTVDLELFHNLALNDVFDMEISGGVRYNDFREALHDVSSGADRLHLNEFDGIGLLGALEFRGHLYRHGAVFGRGRIAGVVGDKIAFDDITDPVLLNDTIQGMYELALGYEYSRTLSNGTVLFAEVAGELQHWQQWLRGHQQLERLQRPSGRRPPAWSFSGPGRSRGSSSRMLRPILCRRTVSLNGRPDDKTSCHSGGN